MQVSEQDSEYSSHYQGRTYYFCSEHCKKRFEDNPERYLVPERGFVSDRKVAVVGSGNVGTTFAYALMMSGLANNIPLIGRSPEKVKAHVMDLNHGMMYVPPAGIYQGDYSDCKDADLVVVTAGEPQKPGETRIDLAEKNTEVFREMIPEIARYNPRNLLIVSNPVDILTYAALKFSGMPMNRVIGSGTVLDTARFRYLLSSHCEVAPRNVQAYILGEHGDSEVPIWSNVRIGGVPMRDYCPTCDKECPRGELDAIFSNVKNAAYEIIKGKGSTSFAIGLALVDIAATILRNENNILTVSTLVDGFYGIRDTCLSIPVLVNRNGVAKTVNIALEDSEIEQLRSSAEYLRGVAQKLGIG
ncbi:MAG: L-lactate dehydrogenase [Desulfohalobiaceae bacterium]|nr:L-lactate dehydrogenase [Desulfohalobiaceae bacterium]